MQSPRKVSILGSTGSVGKSALEVIAHANRSEPGRFEVVALAAGRDAESLAAQALAVRPQLVVVADETKLGELRSRLDGSGIEVAAGPRAVDEAASRPADRVLAAIVGLIGLSSTLAAVRAGTDVAIANKESVVCGGRLLFAEAARTGARILPVDSEHNAIFQCLGDGRALEKLTITASGGPFRSASLAEMARATPKQAASHPNWSMGQKISIDSATLMNKALEFIEAAVLFRIDPKMIDVLVHPQSIIHGMAHFTDGSVIAQLGCPDMKTPISFALGWPDRVATSVRRLDLAELRHLTFERVDETRFSSIRLARAALALGPGGPAVLNCANESAVSAFIRGECGFLDINWAVEETLSRFSSSEFASTRCETIEEIACLDRFGRESASDLLRKAPSRAGG